MNASASRDCRPSVLARAALALNGVFTLALLVGLFVQKGWHLGVGALAVISTTVALGFAGNAALASGVPDRPHPPATASHGDHRAWHRVDDFKRPWTWPLVGALLVAGAVFGAVWFAAGGRL